MGAVTHRSLASRQLQIWWQDCLSLVLCHRKIFVSFLVVGPMTGFSSRVFHPPLPGDGRRRDIFPLPCLQCPETIRGGISRSVQRRIQRKIAETRQVNRALLALNSLYFGGNKILPTASIEELSSLPLCQQDVIKSVIKRVRELGCPPVDACCSGALSALRVPSGSYSDMDPGVGDVVPMRLDQLSLPTGNVAGVNINEHLSGSSSKVVNEFETYMLHDASVWGDLQEYAPSLKPYDDPSLRSHKQYLKFLSHLHQCGVLGFTDQCKGRVGAFTVSKKPKFEGSKRIDRQRLVLDCRQTNLLFKQPPLTELGSLSALSELELGPEEELFASGSDIRDCFYACYSIRRGWRNTSALSRISHRRIRLLQVGLGMFLRIWLEFPLALWFCPWVLVGRFTWFRLCTKIFLWKLWENPGQI